MKKYFLAIFIIACVASSAAYAEFDQTKIKTGGILGINLSNVSGHTETTETRTGYCLGAFINYKQSSYFSFQVELLFNGKGYKIPNRDVSDSLGNFVGKVDVVTILDYLELPVLMKITPVKNTKYSPYLIGGGFLSILLRDKLRVSDTAYAYDYELENSKKTDFGFIIGTGIDLKASQNGWVFFEAKYEVSLISPIQNENHKSRVIAIRGGYWF